MSQMDMFQKAGAKFSRCGKYRYQLWRIWDSRLAQVMFVMHNPSTADSSMDDPTIRRCINYAKSWGYGGIFVGNLSPYRATNPEELKGKDYKVLVPNENLNNLIEMAEYCSMHVLAHGVPANSLLLESVLPVMNWHYLALTHDGHPRHPLYLKSDLKPVPIGIEKGVVEP